MMVRLAIVVGTFGCCLLETRRLPFLRRQRNAEREPRLVVGAQIDVIGEAERHHRFVGGVSIEEPFDVVGMLAHIRQFLRPQHIDDGPPILP